LQGAPRPLDGGTAENAPDRANEGAAWYTIGPVGIAVRGSVGVSVRRVAVIEHSRGHVAVILVRGGGERVRSRRVHVVDVVRIAGVTSEVAGGGELQRGDGVVRDRDRRWDEARLRRVLRQPDEIRERIVVTARNTAQNRSDVVAGMSLLDARSSLAGPARMGRVGSVLQFTGQMLYRGLDRLGQRAVVAVMAILVAAIALLPAAVMRRSGRIGLDHLVSVALFPAAGLRGRGVVGAAEIGADLIRIAWHGAGRASAGVTQPVVSNAIVSEERGFRIVPGMSLSTTLMLSP
jgi:hypothetical protein